MGSNSLTPWCDTCGRSIPVEGYIINNRDCNPCSKWWRDNPPPSDDLLFDFPAGTTEGLI